MEQKFSDVYRTSFLTLDRYLQQSNSAQFYFRPLLPPLNTVTGEFYSLSPAQGTDPSIRINKYSSNGTFLGFGYLYDTSFNVPPDTSGGGANYWTLTGSNIYNNNPGNVGIGTTTPAYPLQVVQPNDAPGLNVVTAGAQGIRVTQSMMDTFKPAEIYFNKNAFLPSLAPPGAVGIDTFIPRGMFIFYNGQDRINITPDGFVGIGTAPTPATRTLEVSGNASIHGPALSNLLFVGDASLNNPLVEQDTVKIGTAGVGGKLAIGDDGKGVLRLLNQEGDTYIEAGTNFTTGSTGRLIFASIFDASGAPTMTVNTGTDVVVISNRYIDPPVAGYKLTVDGSANVLGNVDVSGNTNMFGNLDISAGVLRVYGSGANGAFINGIATFSGPVGINKNPPTVPLDVLGDIKAGNVLPQTSNAYDLGSSSAYWRDLYLSTGTIYMGPTATIGADGSGNVLVNKSNGKGLGININDQSVPDGFALDISGRSLFGSLSDAGRVLLLPQANYTYLQTSAPNGLNITPIGLGDPTLYVNTTTDQVGVNTNAPGAALGISGDLSGNGRLTWYGGPTNINGTATFSGPVGINRNPPAAMLDVLGDISASGPIASSANLVSRVQSFALSVNVSDTDTSFNVDVTALPYSVYLVTIEASIVTSLGSDIAMCIVDISNNVDTQLTKIYPIYAATIVGNSVGAPFTSTTPINKGTGIIKVILRVTDENGNPGGGTFFNNSFVYLNIIGLC